MVGENSQGLSSKDLTSGKSPLAYTMRREVFPQPPSPTMTIFSSSWIFTVSLLATAPFCAISPQSDLNNVCITKSTTLLASSWWRPMVRSENMKLLTFRKPWQSVFFFYTWYLIVLTASSSCMNCCQLLSDTQNTHSSLVPLSALH